MARGISGSPWSFIGGYFFFFVPGMDVVFLIRSATSKVLFAKKGVQTI
jgi:hypothetical protein